MCLGLALSSKLILYKVRVLHPLLLGHSCFCLPSKNKQWHEKKIVCFWGQKGCCLATYLSNFRALTLKFISETSHKQVASSLEIGMFGRMMSNSVTVRKKCLHQGSAGFVRCHGLYATQLQFCKVHGKNRCLATFVLQRQHNFALQSLRKEKCGDYWRRQTLIQSYQGKIPSYFSEQNYALWVRQIRKKF